jgi:hypothetical protein
MLQILRKRKIKHQIYFNIENLVLWARIFTEFYEDI